MHVGGIAERRMAAQKEGHRLAQVAKPGMWFASDDRIGDETFFIGRMVACDSGSCIYKHVDERAVKICGTEFTRGDFAIAVEWWIKVIGDDEERT